MHKLYRACYIDVLSEMKVILSKHVDKQDILKTVHLLSGSHEPVLLPIWTLGKREFLGTTGLYIVNASKAPFLITHWYGREFQKV